MAQEVKKRPLSASEKEIELLKGAFADNEYLLKAVRSLFLGYPVSKTDADVIMSTFKNADVKEALRKKMFPRIEAGTAIGEAADYWFGTEAEIIGKDPETIKQVVESKEVTLKMLEQAFDLLDDPTGKPIDISFAPDYEKDPFMIGLLARNKYIKSVETGLTILKVIAGQKSESVEQAKKRLEADSTK